MDETVRERVGRTYPELDDVEEDDLRESVLRAWARAAEETGVDDLASLPWLPPEQACLDLPDESLVDHVRDVVARSVALTDSLLTTHAGADALALDRDVVLAGPLVHDVSKLYEYDGTRETEVGRLLGHPHFGVHVAAAAAGLPVSVQHVVLPHSHRTAVEPATMEAAIVAAVDAVAAEVIRSRSPRRAP